jgi:glyoxylase-like metal-dependent hydrolase (beta-lactamase superfamily II)
MTIEFVSKRRYGDVEVAAIATGWVHWDPPFPGDWRTDDTPIDAQGRAVMANNAIYVKTPHATMFLDPNSLAPDDDLAPFAELEHGPTIDEGMELLGIDPLEITHVLISHGHPDHYTGVLKLPRSDASLRFPNAEHYFPAADWPQFVSDPPELPPNHYHRVAPVLMKPVERAGKLHLVEGEVEVLPGVRIIQTGGETDGHQVFRIETSEGVLYNLGDLFHLPAEFQHPDWGPGNRDYAALRAAREKAMIDVVASGAAVVSTHGRFPPWGRVETSDGGGWIWRYDSL